MRTKKGCFGLGGGGGGGGVGNTGKTKLLVQAQATILRSKTGFLDWTMRQGTLKRFEHACLKNET